MDFFSRAAMRQAVTLLLCAVVAVLAEPFITYGRIPARGVATVNSRFGIGRLNAGLVARLATPNLGPGQRLTGNNRVTIAYRPGFASRPTVGITYTPLGSLLFNSQRPNLVRPTNGNTIQTNGIFQTSQQNAVSSSALYNQGNSRPNAGGTSSGQGVSWHIGASGAIGSQFGGQGQIGQSGGASSSGFGLNANNPTWTGGSTSGGVQNSNWQTGGLDGSAGAILIAQQTASSAISNIQGNSRPSTGGATSGQGVSWQTGASGSIGGQLIGAGQVGMNGGSSSNGFGANANSPYWTTGSTSFLGGRQNSNWQSGGLAGSAGAIVQAQQTGTSSASNSQGNSQPSRGGTTSGQGVSLQSGVSGSNGGAGQKGQSGGASSSGFGLNANTPTWTGGSTSGGVQNSNWQTGGLAGSAAAILQVQQTATSSASNSQGNSLPSTGGATSGQSVSGQNGASGSIIGGLLSGAGQVGMNGGSFSNGFGANANSPYSTTGSTSSSGGGQNSNWQSGDLAGSAGAILQAQQTATSSASNSQGNSRPSAGGATSGQSVSGQTGASGSIGGQLSGAGQVGMNGGTSSNGFGANTNSPYWTTGSTSSSGGGQISNWQSGGLTGSAGAILQAHQTGTSSALNSQGNSQPSRGGATSGQGFSLQTGASGSIGGQLSGAGQVGMNGGTSSNGFGANANSPYWTTGSTSSLGGGQNSNWQSGGLAGSAGAAATNNYSNLRPGQSEGTSASQNSNLQSIPSAGSSGQTNGSPGIVAQQSTGASAGTGANSNNQASLAGQEGDQENLTQMQIWQNNAQQAYADSRLTALQNTGNTNWDSQANAGVSVSTAGAGQSVLNSGNTNGLEISGGQSQNIEDQPISDWWDHGQVDDHP